MSDLSVIYPPREASPATLMKVVTVDEIEALSICGYRHASLDGPMPFDTVVRTAARYARNVAMRQKLESGKLPAIEECARTARNKVDEIVAARPIEPSGRLEFRSSDHLGARAAELAAGFARIDHTEYLSRINPMIAAETVDVHLGGVDFALRGEIPLVDDKGNLRDLWTGPRMAGNRMAMKSIRLSVLHALYIAKTGFCSKRVIIDSMAFRHGNFSVMQFRSRRSLNDMASLTRRCQSMAAAEHMVAADPLHPQCSPDNCGNWSSCFFGGAV